MTTKLEPAAVVAHDATRGEPFCQLSEFEREWARNQIAALLEARDAAVREAALEPFRELVAEVRRESARWDRLAANMAVGASDGARTKSAELERLADRIARLLPPTPSSKGESGDG